MTDKITFNFDEKRWEGISVLQVKFWESCFPDVDVVGALTKRMPAWIDGNPDRAKKKWKRFIVNWLSKEQERHGQTHINNK